MSAPIRQYDLVLIGASGYTGKLTAEHITTNLPTDLRWALAGRTSSKLEAVAAECKALNPDRVQPAIEVCNLDDTELAALARNTTLLISTTGPFAYYGEHAFKACAENGTHYLDVTGEFPFVAEMIRKYEKTAKNTGSVMFPQIGVESAPPDLVTWTLASLVREKFSAPMGEVIVSIHDLTSKPSGGTLASVLSFLEVFPLDLIMACNKPYALSPIPGPKTSKSRPLLTKYLGLRVDPDLGILTTSLAVKTDTPEVHRSWGLLGGDSFYGPNFHFSEYMRAKGYFSAIAYHFGIVLGSLCLTVPLFRRLAKRFIYSPGEGPTKEEAKKDRVEYRGIAKPDAGLPDNPRAFCRAYFEGSLYKMTGILVSEAAISILRDDHKLNGGIYTPAMLGQKFIDRLDAAGIKFEKKILRNE